MSQLFATPWTRAHQAPLSMEFSWQEYWSGLPFPSPGDLPNPGIEPGSPALQANSIPPEPAWEPLFAVSGSSSPGAVHGHLTAVASLLASCSLWGMQVYAGAAMCGLSSWAQQLWAQQLSGSGEKAQQLWLMGLAAVWYV